MVDRDNLETVVAAAERFLAVPSDGASRHFRQARTVLVDADPDQPIWAHGEYIGRTPLEVDVLPAELRIVVP